MPTKSEERIMKAGLVALRAAAANLNDENRKKKVMDGRKFRIGAAVIAAIEAGDLALGQRVEAQCHGYFDKKRDREILGFAEAASRSEFFAELAVTGEAARSARAATKSHAGEGQSGASQKKPSDAAGPPPAQVAGAVRASNGGAAVGVGPS